MVNPATIKVNFAVRDDIETLFIRPHNRKETTLLLCPEASSMKYVNILGTQKFIKKRKRNDAR